MEEMMEGGDEMLLLLLLLLLLLFMTLVPGLDWNDGENGTRGALELEQAIR